MPRIAPGVRDERRQQLVDAAWRCAAAKRFPYLTVDDVCAAAGVSKGTFYGYFDSKRDLLFALLDDSAAALDRVMADLAAADLSGVERLRRFTRAMLEQADDPARVQVRADLWADLLTDDVVRARFSDMITRRRTCLRIWIEDGVAAGELAGVPANAVASILLALGDGLMLHARLDAAAFKWINIERALDMLLDGIAGSGPGSTTEPTPTREDERPADSGEHVES